MPQKITTNTAHAEIARDIRLAKQRMFREHSKGTPLRVALQGFLTEVIKSTREQESLLAGETKPEKEPERSHSSSDGPIYEAATLDELDLNPAAAREYAEQETHVHTVLEDAIFIDGGVSTPRRQQRSLVKLLDMLCTAPKDDRDDLLVSARDFAIKNSPELTEEIAAKVCGREIENKNAGVDVDRIRARAQAVIDNPATKPSDDFHVREILAAEKWDDLKEVLDAIEKGHSYVQVMARNDERTLSDDQVEDLCFQLASHLQGEHFAGYFFALLEHISAQAQTKLVDDAVYEISKRFLAHNIHGSDAAAEMLRMSALANLREQDAENGGEA